MSGEQTASTGSKSHISHKIGEESPTLYIQSYSRSSTAELKHSIVKKQFPERSWLANCARFKLADVAGKLYHCGPGYNFISPKADCSVYNPHARTTAVYLKHLKFGLRFLLNTEVKNILKAMNVALCHLHPSSIRKIISFVWMCKYMGYDPTVNVFQALHMLIYSTKYDCWLHDLLS